MNYTVERNENSIQKITWNGVTPIKEETEEKPLATLVIPKIYFQRNLYAKNSKENDLSKNIIFLPTSDLPDQTPGIVLIAGHSGTGAMAYFQNLDQIQTNDILLLLYKNSTYAYEVVERLNDPKTGSIHFFTDPKKDYLILTTCMPHEKGRQLTIIAEKKNSN